MKYTLLLVLCSLILACNPDNLKQKNWEKNAKTVLSGSIDNYDKRSMPSKMTLYFYDDIFNQVSTNIQIDSLGNFNKEIELPRPQDVNFYYRKWLSVILFPGDSIHLSFDGNQAEKKDLLTSMKISGDSKSLNEDYKSFLVNDSVLNSFYAPIAKISPEEFIHHHDSLFKLRNNYISNFLKTKSISDPALQEWLKVEQGILPITKIVEFPMFYRMYNRNKLDSLSYPDGFFSKVQELSQITEDSYINGNLGTLSNQLLFHYYDKVDKESKSKDRKVKDSLLFELLIRDFPENPIPIQLAIADRVRADLKSMNTGFVDTNLDQLKSIYGDTDFGTAIFEAYEDTKAELANTDLPEDAEFLEFESQEPKEYLNEIIQKVDGKIIYIDHWATWCGPCRGEFERALPEFKKKYKEDIQFVYLCYSSEKEEWHPMIRKYQLSGMHYFVEKEENKILHEQMSVNGYPTYTIINQNGDIIKSDSRYRPSQNRTSQILDSLLQKNTRP